MPPHRTSLWSLLVTPLVYAVSYLKGRATAQPPSSLNTDQDVELQPSKSCEQALAIPPQDRGYAAWSFLFAAAIVEAVTWSIPFSSGILIADFLEFPDIAAQPNASTLIPLVGMLGSGIIYCSGPLVYPYMSGHRTHIRPMMWLGMTLCWVSILIASYSRKVYVYVVFQGILYGVGGSLVYPPCILYMTEWFLERRGLANGVLFAATPTGSFIMPFLLPSLVKTYGLFMALRIIAVATLALLFPCLMFIRPRLPVLQVGSHSTCSIAASSITLRNRAWWLLVAANICQGFAFFVPFVHIPMFTTALGLNGAISSLPIALLNGRPRSLRSSAAGPLLVGLLSDHFMPWPIAFILSTLSLLCTVIFWGVVGDVTGVMLFSVTYGVVAGGWSTLWSSFIRQISNDDPSLSMSMYGVLMLTRGIGNIVSTPISTALAPAQSPLHTASGRKQAFVFDDGRYGHLIAYLGVCNAAAILVSVVGWRWGVTKADRQSPSFD